MVELSLPAPMEMGRVFRPGRRGIKIMEMPSAPGPPVRTAVHEVAREHAVSDPLLLTIHDIVLTIGCLFSRGSQVADVGAQDGSVTARQIFF